MSDKVALLFISQGRKFQKTRTTYLIKCFPKHSVLIFGTQNSDFERNFVFITNMLSRTSDTRPYLLLIVEYYFNILRKFYFVPIVS